MLRLIHPARPPEPVSSCECTTESAAKLHVDIAIGDAAVIVDDADEMRALSGWAPGKRTGTGGKLADENRVIEPEHVADVGRGAGIERSRHSGWELRSV